MAKSNGPSTGKATAAAKAAEADQAPAATSAGPTDTATASTTSTIDAVAAAIVARSEREARAAGDGAVGADALIAAAPAAEVTATDKQGRAEIPALFVRAVPEQGFRRCGIGFTREGIGIALDALSEEQIAALRAEPNLVVEETTFLPDEAAD